MKRYFITCAQNDTPYFPGFLDSLKCMEQHLDVRTRIVPITYNPGQSGDWTADGEPRWFGPTSLAETEDLAPRLKLLGDSRVIPTARRPTGGFEVFAGKHSLVIPHPKQEWRTLSSGDVNPRIVVSTGACTLPNYRKARAGYAAAKTHSIGGLLVTVSGKRFWTHHVQWSDERGGLVHMGYVYRPDGSYEAIRPEVLVVGDRHIGQDDPTADQALARLVRHYEPEHIVLHDLVDGYTHNHHERFRPGNIRGEVERVATWLRDLVDIAPHSQIHVVDSNHHDFLVRWYQDSHPEDLCPEDREIFAEVLKARTEGRVVWEHLVSLTDDPPAVHWLQPGEPLVFGRTAYHHHGHVGVGGARGSTESFAKSGRLIVTGHTHCPTMFDGAITVGHMSAPDHGYNRKGLQTWMQACSLHWSSPTTPLRTLVPVIRGQVGIEDWT